MPESSFEHIKSTAVESLHLTVEEYRHRPTGARHLHLAAEDDNNAFLVAFLTVPQDSTGVAHILEHTSLCGSERFPMRDPFFMMTRRSLNTFMNAFTSTDWTAYPFATRNRKDFDNLLQVYMDAVFFPRLDPLDFAQEGHRVEPADPADPDSELVFKGVVYNEMKGAMSSPVSRLWHLLQSRLFPTITYHYNSGGDPEAIPDLTYEQLKRFHTSHYHPSNAVFMTYGDMPAGDHQKRLEAYGLKRFSALELDLGIPDERRYSAPVRVVEHYPIEGEEGTSGKTHIVLGWLLGKGADLRESMQTHLLSGVLLDNSSSPLRHALETTILGSSPSELCGADDSTREMTFVCGLEGSDPEHAEAVEDLILGVIRRVAEEGVPQETVESVLHQLELAQREIRAGHVPYGLRLMVNALSPTLHGGDPAAFLNLDPVLRELRESVTDPGFLPGLARRLLLENPHRVRVVMAPDPDLGAGMAEAERRRLATLRAVMDEAERGGVLEQARALQARQLQRDDPSLLPKVGLEDVPPEMRVVEGEPQGVAGMPATWFGQGTNGLVYSQVVVDLPPLPEPLVDLLPLFCDCATEVGCGERDYLAAQAWQAAFTGGVSADTSVRAAVDDVGLAHGYFVLGGKALVRNGGGLAQVLREVFERARFDELPRLRELVAQLRAERELAVTDHGHVLAMAAACAGMSPTAALAHRWNGLLGLRQLKALDDALRDDDRLAEFAAGLTQIRDVILEAPRRLLLVGEPAQRESLVTALETEWEGIAEAQRQPARFVPPGTRHRVREAWAVNTQVSFCARAYPTVPVEHEDAAALSVLGNFLTNGFLHGAVREQGGAYGAGASYDSDGGAFRFYSYRDPRLEETLSDFDEAVHWLREEAHEPRELEEAILGLIAAIDRPESPAGEAVKAFFGDLHGRTAEQRRRFRQRVLGVSLDDLIRVGEQWLDPSRASTAVVSHAGTLQASAGGLGLEMKRL
jgi:Zn-dependent M16 (insulinase) family peptidase